MAEIVLFGEGFWGLITATAALVLIAVVGGLILLAAKRSKKVNPTPQKFMTYTGGELLSAEEIHIDSEQFFSPIRRVFGPFYRHIRPGHSGDLNTYLNWVAVGLVLIFVLITLLMGVRI